MGLLQTGIRLSTFFGSQFSASVFHKTERSNFRGGDAKAGAHQAAAVCEEGGYMEQPLNDYFIATSHNSYLTGNQLTSESDTRMYEVQLQMGLTLPACLREALV